MLVFISSGLFIACSADGPRIVYSIDIGLWFKDGLKCLRRRIAGLQYSCSTVLL